MNKVYASCALYGFLQLQAIEIIDISALLPLPADQMCSQYCQDNFIDTFITQKKENGFFVDIGAHDGKKWSNSYFFEKVRNWNGICIEPIQEVYQELVKNRNVLCICGGVSSYDGIAEFYRVQGEPEQLSGLVSTYHPDHKNRMTFEIKRDNGGLEIQMIPVFTLNTILEKYKVFSVDYLSIDTEGSEFEIIKAIDFDRFYIQVMSIENTHHGQALRDFLKSKGFVFVARLFNCDDIFVNTRQVQ